MAKYSVSAEIDGRTYTLETGRFAKFANGSVMVSCGESMVLVTTTASSQLKDSDFMPLQVEYREKAASAGKYPGGFLKREGRPSDNEVLTSRLIDRPIRPMFPKVWRYDTQIIATCYSAEPAINPDTLGGIGASAALMLSDIPFNGPISGVRVGRIDGELMLNPSHEDLKNSDIDMIVAGTDSAITMVEGESNEISETDFLEALEFAHVKIKALNDLQKEFVKDYVVEKRTYVEVTMPEEILEFVDGLVHDDLKEYIYAETTKKERTVIRATIKEKVLEAGLEKFEGNEDYAEGKLPKLLIEAVEKIEKGIMRAMITKDGKRLDGRATDQVRVIDCEAGLLPRAHGSSLFTRGETQSLTTVTLGTGSDEQMIDGLQPTYTNKFYLHYNFPPFCTGETGRLGLGRREIGHGHLAERALKKMMPADTEFPYTVRVVSDILESNGSSSMATVCAGSLALFDAGVPMKKPVAGIAMGLIKEGDDVAILSDILGDEDFLGDMDFKLAGTVDGITAYQMDIKIEGLPIEIMTKAMEQAKAGRLYKLKFMGDCLETPREDISKYAPRFTVLSVPTESIGAVIGPGGEMIRRIVSESGVTDIKIDDEGVIKIAAISKTESDIAVEMIKQVTAKPKEGEVYTECTVKEIRPELGAFVEFMPGKQGLLHISQIAYERTENIEEIFKVGDQIDVKLLEVTRDGKFRLSRRALLPAPEGWVERPPRPRSNDRGRDNRGGGRDRDNRGRDNRGGGRDNRR
jgi:polyribonucleotide nucleotidyltransferase